MTILHGMLAPEKPRSKFASVMQVAELLERHCEAGQRSSGEL
jgi:hypothetical protein